MFKESRFTIPDNSHENLTPSIFEAVSALTKKWPGKNILTVAIAAAMTQACAATEKKAEYPEAVVHEQSAEYVKAKAKLAKMLTEKSGDAEGADENAAYLLGHTALPRAEWLKTRGSLINKGGAQAIINPDLMPIDVGAMNDLASALPRTWTSHAINSQIVFLDRPSFNDRQSKHVFADANFDQHSGNWETVCTSGFSNLDKTSSIYCNADLIKEYGYKKALRESFFHEFAHSADPGKLPLPANIKAEFWARQQELVDSGHAPDSKYIAQWTKSIEGQRDATAYRVLLVESWAETMATVFKTAEQTKDTDDWETWESEYIKALIADYGCDQVGAHETSNLIKDYFTEIDPGFKPWESSKTINKILPIEKL